MYDTSKIIFEKEEEYHSRSKRGECLSSHLLQDFLKNPLLYHKKIQGLVKEKQNDAYLIGSATHKLVLEGERVFHNEYKVSDGPINVKTGNPYGKTTNAYNDWLANQDKKVISSDDFTQISIFNESVRNHDIASRLLSKGVAEGVLRESICGVQCQIRMDFFNPESGLIDYKTCAELRYFETDAKRYGYLLQMAFYRAVIQESIGCEVPIHIIATEKCEPFSTGVWLISSDVLDYYYGIIKAGLNRFKECSVSNTYPTGYESIRIINQD